MDFVEGSNDTKICGPAKIDCCSQALSMIHLNHDEICKCLPACTMVSYDVDVSQAKFDLFGSWSRSKFQQLDFEKYEKLCARKMTKNALFLENISVFTVQHSVLLLLHLKKSTLLHGDAQSFITSRIFWRILGKKWLQYFWAILIAIIHNDHFRGIFGLFMGASLLSFVELIYYFTLRFFYMEKDKQVIEYRAPKKQTRIFTVLPWNQFYCTQNQTFKNHFKFKWHKNT